VTEIRKNPIPVFNPTRSKIMKSPLYGVVETRMGPAPLHPHDPRVEEEIPHLVKHAAAKYRVDKFEPDEENLNRAMMQTASQLFAVTGRCGRWTIEEALSGGGGNPVDLTTSPGRKYTLKKLQKKDLVHRNENGILVPTPSFREDVNEAVRRIERGEAQTTFVANLKDELRPLAKIKAGGARCIEMCEFDYVVAHRMILGPMFEKIYNAEMTSTGIAVGCNPYTDFNLFFGTASENWIAIDYSRYDGSLSEGLMRKGVEVLAACHEDPELVEKLLEPVVMSTHLVADEEWFVKGGMPSGSPCTSVLNSVCNLIVVKTACLSAGVEKPEDIQIVTYGDDVLMTIDYDFCDDALPEIIHSQFGMEATSANKLSKTLKVSPADATFLKRSFRLFPDTQFVTGVLDLENMMQKIQWCHGKEAFIQQWTSFTQELVLHGRETYERVIRLCSPRLDQYKIFTPRYDQRYKEVYQSIFM
nr:3D [Potamipivirus A]